ncbi:MAG TPA: TIGR02391 family protein [Acidimicrobiales bacterium]
MPLDLDAELALQQVRHFQALLLGSEGIYERHGTRATSAGAPLYYFETQEWKVQEQLINQKLPVIERIATTLDDRLKTRIRLSNTRGWPHKPKIAVLDEMVGILQGEADADAIFTPKGPGLAAKDLHPWVWNAAVDLWSDGHHREAVQRAATALFDSHLPAKLETDGKPLDLINQAFDLEPPAAGKHRLRIPGYSEGSDSWKNVHNGARFIGMGCLAAIRNLATHDLHLDEQRALEELAALSLFARWVAEAEVVKV